MSRSLRTFSALIRPVTRSPTLTRSRHSTLRQNGHVNIQPVHFVRDNKGRIAKLAFKLGIGLALGYFVLQYFDLEEEEVEGKTAAVGKNDHKDGDRAEKEGEEEAGNEDVVLVPEEIPDDAIFIPLGFTRQRPQTYYKGSDPEWQSFIEFRKDRRREVAVRKELAGLVGGHFAAMRPLQKELGVPINISKAWLDVLIPEGPPLEYERSGLEIADEYIAWTTRPVSSLQRSRLQAALFPLPMAKSFWASYSTYWSLQLARLKNFLNINPPSEDAKPGLPSGMMDLHQLAKNKQEPQAPTGMDKMSDPKSAESKSSDVPNSKVPPSKQPTLDSSRILTSLPAIPQVGGDLGSAVSEFKRTLAKTWHSPHTFGERGTLLVTGLIQIEGPKGFCVLDVSAAYHPRESRYTVIAGKVRTFQPKSQSPRGDQSSPRN